MIPMPPAGGNQFGVHKHVELTADGRRRVSGQPVEDRVREQPLRLSPNASRILNRLGIADAGPYTRGVLRENAPGESTCKDGSAALR
jgi:hypothetical protein